MSNILVIVDGMEDIKYRELGFKTPIDFIGGFEGLKCSGYKSNTPKGFEPDSLNCILNMIGVKKEFIPKGRAYLEALANNIKVSDDDLVMRCNTVKLKDFKIDNVCTGKFDIIGTENIKVFYIGAYRNIMIVHNAKKFFNDIILFPPYQNIGKNIFDVMPTGNDMAQIIKNFCVEFMNKNNVGLIPWGKAVKKELPKYFDIHGKDIVIISGTDIVKGIAIAMNIKCPDIIGATGDIDTDIKQKTSAVIRYAKNNDIIVHVNGADESGHRKNVMEKVEFIKKLNCQMIQPLLSTKHKITVTSDHATICKTGNHDKMKVAVYERSIEIV